MREGYWPKIIIHVDMDAFFAQVEQRDNPKLRGKPVCITNGEKGSCIITRSYEARAYGVKTGMRLAEARRLCPNLIRCPSRPGVYAAISTQIMHTLATITPDMEIFSVDEAFLDLSHCRGLYRTAQSVGRLIKQRVLAATRLDCSVGISGDKTTAKIASKRSKPDGLLVIPPWQSQQRLAALPVTDICGIGPGVAKFLAQYGVYYCGQMQHLPISVLAKRFGNIGRRLWYMCLGQDPDFVKLTVDAPKSVGHGKVMPPNTTDRAVILQYLSHMAEKVAFRLRANSMVAQTFWIGIKQKQGWLADRYKTVQPTNDGLLIYHLAESLIELYWDGGGVYQCQITANNPQMGMAQLDLFAAGEQHREKINHIVDAVNDKFGPNTLSNAKRLNGMQMPDVIAPAWRPSGVRSSIATQKKSK
jgi:DNA polymerase IV